MSVMNVGDEWAYRQRDQAPSERVRILTLEQKRQSFRADVEFLDGEHAGVRENVSGRRLKVPWCDVAAYDQRMKDWERLRQDCALTPVEDFAAVVALGRLVPEEVAEHHDRPVEGMTVVTDRGALDHLLVEPLDFVLERCEWLIDDDGALVVSPRGTLLICELACRKNPMPILDEVMEEEQKARYYSKKGRTEPGGRGREDTFHSPEKEHSWYLHWIRPRHEVLRQWCGHRAITIQERLVAAESEVRRLDELLQRALDRLEEVGDESTARWMTRSHVEDRISPDNVRPIVERPLAPWDCPPSPEPRKFRRSWW